ncbi:MAG: Cell division integral membrane protein, YggT and half-length relatives, partial [uncultured Thermomicrobiales bacterium]
ELAHRARPDGDQDLRLPAHRVRDPELARRLQRRQPAQRRGPHDRQLPPRRHRAVAAADPERPAQSRRHRRVPDHPDPASLVPVEPDRRVRLRADRL